MLQVKLNKVEHFLVNAASTSYQQMSPKKPSSFFNSMSEIASCSYEARAVGVRNGMFLGAARKLCPDIYCVPYQFEQYRQVSQRLYDILVTYSHEIEAVSCDEAYIDVSETLEGICMIFYALFFGLYISSTGYLVIIGYAHTRCPNMLPEYDSRCALM